MISRIMMREFPFIKDVNVTADRDMHSHYIDKEKNVIYNVWFEIEEWEPFDDWKKFEDEVKEIKNGLGLQGKLRFYYTKPSDEY